MCHKIKNIGLYIHIPFCKKKCEYCDFISYTGKENLIEKYINCVKHEIKEIGEQNLLDYKNDLDDLVQIKTIYIGGGTPSFINSKYIAELLDVIRRYYMLDRDVEITLEINPGTVCEYKLKEYKTSGINRLSIGLQETHDKILKNIGRIHTYEDFLNTYNLARKIGFNNINVDLMIGLPNQTLMDLDENIDNVIKLKPEHISVYSLILEEETPLYFKVKSNKVQLPDDELERKMYWKVKEKLQKAGYIHYEISNFAKAGYESKHNLSCWNQEEYIGVGVAAHSYTNNIRYSVIENIEEYIKNIDIDNEADNIIFHEKQNPYSKMQEYMLLGLRKINGIKIQEFKNKFGMDPIDLYKKELEQLNKKELIEIDEDSIRLTNKGLDLANLVWEEFV